jgi:hypothetical protein
VFKTFFSHPQAYKLGDKNLIIMKEYNGIFTVQFTVQELANKLMESYLGKMPMPLIEEVQAVASGQSDFNVSEEVEQNCKYYMKDYQHYERLVESIVDCVENSQDACATIFNALNGWVKFDVPGLKKIPRREETQQGKIQLSDIREEILAEEISEMDDFILEKNILNIKEQLKDEDRKGWMDCCELRDRLNMLQTEWNDRNNH